METQFRPFALVTQQSGSVAASSIVLKDTGGNELACNFISVEASGENPDAYFRVITNPGARDIGGNMGSRLITPMANSSDTSGALGDTSGIVGGYSSVNKGVVELLLADGDRTSVIEIGLSEAGTCNFFITYGQIQAGNVMADNERPVGG